MGRPAARSLVTRALDEGLQHHRREAMALRPVLGQPPGRHAEHLGRQARTVHPRQDQEAGVVDHAAQPAAPLRIIPADVPLTVGELPGSGREADQRHQLLACADAAAQLLAGHRRVAQVVMPGHELVPQPGVLTAPLHDAHVRPHHVGQQCVDAARLLGLGAEDSLAKVAVLGLGQGEFSVNRGKLLAQLSRLAVVKRLQPLQARHGPCMQ